MKTEIKKTNRKKSVYYIVAVVIITILLFLGTTFAYFSDMFMHNEEGGTSTLKISGNYTFYLNETEISVNGLKNLNPGDVIVIKAKVNNLGNQSAWIREKFVLETEDEKIQDYFQIYDGSFTRADLALEQGDSSNYLMAINNGTANLPNKIINGYGSNGEIESGEDYTYLNSSDYETYITVYFLPTVSNEAQGKSFGLKIITQALQFRNNNISEPNELAWSTVAASPIGK